jgi:YegS/Rv2252/BmrU family lipid kinase
VTRTALLIWNPASGGGRRHAARLPAIVRALATAGFDVTVQPTTEAGHATALATDACRRGGCDVVFGLGGDGTLREIAVGLVGKEVPLAILPGGTTNVLALALGVPANPLRAAELYGASEIRALDVGMAAGIPFLMMITAGVDSVVLRRASQAAKKRFGRLAVAAQALAALRAYDAETRTLVDGDHRVEGSFVVASNIRYYGGPFELTPSADPLDGLLDFAVFSGHGGVAMLELALDVVTGTHLSRGDFTSWKGKSARLEGDGEAWVQIDGDPLRLTLPIEIALSPERLSILLPTPRRNMVLGTIGIGEGAPWTR